MPQLPALDGIRADPVDAAAEERARLKVVRRANDPDDAARLLAMLGLDGAPARRVRRNKREWPSNLDAIVRERCLACGAAMSTHPEGAQVRRGSRDLCGKCEARRKRGEHAGPLVTEHVAVLEALRSPAWMDDGLCANHPDPELWFSDVVSGSAVHAKQICHHCPVRRDCGDTAAKRDERHGIAAGFHTAEPAEWQRLWKWLGLDMPKDKQRASRNRELICSECGDQFTTQRRTGTRCFPCMRDLVEIGPVAEHIAALGAQGTSATAVARAARVSASVVLAVANRRQKWIGRDKAERILAIRIDTEAVSV